MSEKDRREEAAETLRLGDGSEGRLARDLLGPAAPEVAATTPATGPPATSPIDRIGPYEVLSEVGHGGMGLVYRARDTRLDRVVALKVLITGEHASPEAIERFRREAAVVARMGKHPHVVQVHDFGAEGARHYFTMDFVEGQSLRGWLRTRRSPREVMEVAHKVALALAHAHAAGVVHRDLKPDNVLVDAAGQPQVTDFGLARDVGASAKLSVSGQLMGTPAYMAPEQAAGRLSEIGPWTDVYAFGATLYEAFSGHLPHGGKEIGSILYSVMREDAAPLRRKAPGVSAEIETIVMKCLERRPEARYRDGTAVAAEVARYLAGEPLEARPIGALSRVWRRTRRNPVVSALAGAAILLAVAAGGVAWRAAMVERELVDGHLRELARSGNALVEAALARRAIADLAGMRRFEAELVEPVRALKARAPLLAEPWYYEGRMHHAQGRAPEAEACQRRAVELARRPGAVRGSRAMLAPALYELGILLAQRYQAEREARRADLLRTRAIGRDPRSPAPPPPSTTELLEGFPALEALRSSAVDDLRESLDIAGPALGPRREVASAVIRVLQAETLEAAAAEEATRGAVEGLGRAITEDCHIVEAYPVFASIYESQARWEDAEKAYGAGHAVDRGHLPFLLGAARAALEASQAPEATLEDAAAHRRRGLQWIDRLLALDATDAIGWTVRADLHLHEGRALAYVEEDPTGAYAEAILECGKALSARPSCVEALDLMAVVRLQEASWRYQREEDSTSACEQAIAGSERVLALLPTDLIAMNNLSSACVQLGQQVARDRGDPSAWFDRAIATAKSALAVDPRDPAAMTNLAMASHCAGDWHAGRGDDPTTWYAQAVTEYDRVLAVQPEDATTMRRRGIVHSSMAMWKEKTGEDPMPELLVEWEWAERAVKACPSDPSALWQLASSEDSIAYLLARRGEDPTARYGRSIELLDRTLAVNPRLGSAADSLAYAWRRLGDWQHEHGQDAHESMRRAVASGEKAVSLAPQSASLARGLAGALGALGGVMKDHGEDPIEVYARAEREYERAIALDPLDTTSMGSLALVHRNVADWRKGRGEDPREALRKSIAAYERRVAVLPRDTSRMGYLAETRVALGDWRRDHGEDPADDYRAAIEDLAKALEIDPKDEENGHDLALYHLRLGDRHRKHGEDGTGEYRSALDVCDRLLSGRPDLAGVHGLRGQALEKLDRLEEAIAAFREAVRLAPGRDDLLRRLVGAHLRQKGEAIPAWQREVVDGGMRLGSDLRGGREALERGLAAFEREVEGLTEAERHTLLADPVVRAMSSNAYYNLACVLAMASAGEAERRGARKEVTPTEAERLRAQAFRRLDQAIACGYANRAHSDEDPDLAGLRDDPRWAEWINRLEESISQRKEGPR